MIDVSPGARGGNTLGANDGTGHAVNPATGRPYAPDVVNLGDFGRVMAEFWADGPKSETPPGHWNVLANAASDELAPNLRIGGAGAVVGRLEWDVKLYLALNGAVHDAAIAAWGLKGHYDSVRPISMIRYLGGRGQSSDPAGPSYDREGLPLVPGLIEVITRQSSAPGQRHAALAASVGKIAIWAWAGNPADPKSQTSGAAWMLAGSWVPYQLPTFVTPSFPAYASGHSTFSRAAAEVMTAFTGSEYFPGGVSGYTIPANSLKFEKGPTTDIRLEWATYYDAADQAGQSRIWGGIHIQADDFTGRIIGSQCGKDAWAAAQRFYAGKVSP
ncbi:MAG: vanadium-dependent haloperoxidase [Chloroflexi bacterium]|nr:MAG: vanadium-dependent haloperoxidase [Chloroflexota bacterium]